jgi:hypothetical protein
MPTVTIDDSIYPNQRGVQLFVDGKADDRSPTARPDGWDATGPQHNSTFHHYPKLTLQPGMELEARWTDKSGTSFRSVHIVGGKTLSGDDSQTSTAAPSVTKAPTPTTAPHPQPLRRPRPPRRRQPPKAPTTTQAPTTTEGAHDHPGADNNESTDNHPGADDQSDSHDHAG